MNRIKDERIKFYLEHEEQIEEWAGIKREAHELADKFYRSLRESLRCALKARRMNDVKSFIEDDGGDKSWPTIGLRRHSWPEDDDDPDVRLQWHKRDTGFGSGPGPYCGVRANQEKYGELFEGCKELYPKKSRMWRFRDIDVRGGRPERYWEADKLREYRQVLIDELLKAWCELSPLIDKAFGLDAK